MDFFGWKYLEMMLISFLDLAGRGGRGGALLIVTRTGFAISFLLLLLVGIVLGVNFEDIFDLSVLVFLISVQYIPSSLIDCRDEISDGITHTIKIVKVINLTTINLFVFDIFGQEIERYFDILGV